MAERKELEGMEETIMLAEEVVAELETKLNDPEFQKNFAEIPSTVAKLDAAKAEVARLYDRWEELGALV
jgi:ATP-binding cassette subfamily F protein uup